MLKRKKDLDFKFNLGDEVKDTITSFSGIIFSRTQWLHNCNTYSVKSKFLKDGKPIENQWFDEPQLELLQEKTVEAKRDTGGPCNVVPPTNR